MQKPFSLFIIPVIILAFFIVSCDMGDIKDTISDIVSGDDRASWDDPKGDVPDKIYTLSDGSAQTLPALDVVKATAQSGEGVISITLKVSETFDKFFSRVDRDGKIHNMSLAAVYIDTDDNVDTGGSPPGIAGAERPLVGYDIYIPVMPSLQYRRSSGAEGAVSGETFIDTRQQEVTGSYATYIIRKVSADADKPEFNTKLWSKNKRDYSSLKGNAITIRIPYEWLNLKAGDTVRLCYKEWGQGASSGKSFSEDKKLKLK